MRERISRTQSVMQSRAFRKVMVAVDGPENSAKELEVATTIAAQNRAELVILHVVTPPPTLFVAPDFGVQPALFSRYYESFYEEPRKRDWRWLSGLARAAEENGVRATAKVAMPTASVAEEVVRVAEGEEVDLIVTGTTSGGIFERLLRGSVSKGVVDRAKCPVLTVR